jgi:uncharacterized protein with HEPN domain
MSPVEREFILYLEDMLESMVRIEEYLREIDFRKFKKNYLVVDATIRNFEVIGEASRNVPKSIQENILKFLGEKCMDLGI